eukprot:745735-Hanusia_phi.AAC.2
MRHPTRADDRRERGGDGRRESSPPALAEAPGVGRTAGSLLFTISTTSRPRSSLPVMTHVV